MCVWIWFKSSISLNSWKTCLQFANDVNQFLFFFGWFFSSNCVRGCTFHNHFRFFSFFGHVEFIICMFAYTHVDVHLFFQSIWKLIISTIKLRPEQTNERNQMRSIYILVSRTILFFIEKIKKKRPNERVPLQPTRPKYTRLMYSKSEAMIYTYTIICWIWCYRNEQAESIENYKWAHLMTQPN